MESHLVEFDREPARLSEAAKSRLLTLPGEPLFLADWREVLMFHYEVDCQALQPLVPFDLDLYQDRAFVTLVAFHLAAARPPWLSRKWGRWFGCEQFLNVRTYVNHRGERGIFFLAEWVSRRLSVALGPMFFGLPYRAGQFRYDHWGQAGSSRGLGGEVMDKKGKGRFAFRGDLHRRAFTSCDPGSLGEWLMERYTAFTLWRGKRRFFRVWHEPWLQVGVDPEILEDGLLRKSWPFLDQARLLGAIFSPGVFDVWMGRPHGV